MSLASELHKIKIRQCPSHGLVMGMYANNNTWWCTKCVIEENENLHAENKTLRNIVRHYGLMGDAHLDQLIDRLGQNTPNKAAQAGDCGK